ncbi:uncharacterized protein BBOV_IV004670 [Babesia bovis T2Bo]|uniref:Uncharacterized protein n=1 Tax=Babesia bovis TaxID=5865 RepID=A7AQK9_BABBO|nr:uncharacterized protein BBOV_IV004670 [Babesia bovis T2Bo]EDO06828.1 hypothetical protein BBOV_IV004670 [Babesia bovis T2Bo]|eukprot:XP_001610396.1 hypothetical protein [Babesia bovis T2Bo]
MLNKKLVFSLAKDAIKRRSLNIIAQIERSFDYHLDLSISALSGNDAFENETSKDVSDQKIKTVSKEVIRSIASIENVALERSGSISLLGIDCLRPHEIVLGFQLVDIFCSLKSPLELQMSDRQKIEVRLRTLMMLACSQIDAFDFVKTALVMNALVNIIQNGHIDAVLVNGLRKCNTATVGFDRKLRSAWNHKSITLEDYSLVNALTCFHDTVSTNVMVSLNLFSTRKVNESALKVPSNEIDAHSICMVLKYYAALNYASFKLVSLILKWIETQNEMHIEDKYNILISLGKLDNSELYLSLKKTTPWENTKTKLTYESRNINLHHSSDVKSGTTTKNHLLQENEDNNSMAEVFISSVIRLKSVGNASVKRLQLYIASLVKFRERAISLDILRQMATGALKDASTRVFPGTQQKQVFFTVYASLLYNIKLCTNNPPLLSRSEIQEFFLSNNVQNSILASLLSLAKNPTKTRIQPLADICVFMKLMGGVNHVPVAKFRLTHFRKVLKEVIGLSFWYSSESFIVRHFNEMSEYLYGDNAFKPKVLDRLCIIYKEINQNSIPHDVLRIYIDLTGLLRCLYRENVHVTSDLHEQIKVLIHSTYKNIPSDKVLYIMRMIHSLARILNGDVKLHSFYDFKGILFHILSHSQWKDNVLLLVDILYNLLPSSISWIVCETNSTQLLDVLTHYHTSVVLPRFHLPSPWQPTGVENPLWEGGTLDISVFAKYVHIVWTIQERSSFHREAYLSKLCDIVCHLSAFQNAKRKKPALLNFCDDEYGSKKGNERWQSFSVHLLARVLLQMHKQSVGSQQCNRHPDSTALRGLAFLCQQLSDSLDHGNDHKASMNRLTNLLTDHIEYVACIEIIDNMRRKLLLMMESQSYHGDAIT